MSQTSKFRSSIYLSNELYLILPTAWFLSSISVVLFYFSIFALHLNFVETILVTNQIRFQIYFVEYIIKVTFKYEKKKCTKCAKIMNCDMLLSHKAHHVCAWRSSLQYYSLFFSYFYARKQNSVWQYNLSWVYLRSDCFPDQLIPLCLNVLRTLVLAADWSRYRTHLSCNPALVWQGVQFCPVLSFVHVFSMGILGLIPASYIRR
jgi:hypothetical protein